jgi:hypothetical protein
MKPTSNRAAATRSVRPVASVAVPKRAQELSRAEVIAELRQIAAQLDRPVHATDVPDGLRFAVQRHFGSIDAARNAARLPHPDLAHRWSREILIAELQRLHHAGVRITDTELAKDYGDVLGAIRNYFSGMSAARRAARIPEPAPLIAKKRQRWDEARVVAEIEELDRSGESLAASKVPLPLLKAGKRYFGSWSAALEAAGIDPKGVQLVRGAYSEEELLEILRTMAKNNPDMQFGELWEYGFINAIMRIFGDVETALERAKIRNWPVRQRGKTMSRGDVIAAIRGREREGEATYRDVVIEEDHLLWHSAMVHFGSWLAAAEAAGVDLTDHNRRWSRESLIDALRARKRDGKSLRPSDVQREDGPLYQSLRAYFGSYVAACESAGLALPH